VLKPTDDQQFFPDHDQEQEEKNKRPVFIRILAFFTLLAFIGLVFLTTWPDLTLPSLDFLSRSKELSKDLPVNQLKQYVVQINVVSMPGRVIAGQKSGTGFNISPDGTIVTNRHVLSDAVSITVTFPGGKTYPVKSYKTSPDLDLALIYLEAEGLPAATVNTEKKAKVGDKVFIIGNPLGIGNVIMEGAISAFIRVSGCPAPVFVIDAPVHPGNSGSPVFDEDKKVVGVVFGSIHQKDDPDHSKQQGVAIPAGEILEFINGIS
jgi:S1-C subfamily serine protease